jgi:hypothetical protein
MNVDELALSGDLHFDFGDQCCGWLLIPRLTVRDRARLAFLTSIREELLPELFGAPHAIPTERRFHYCQKCLWINPLDVTAPYWKEEWICADENSCEKVCSIHRCGFEYISQADLSKCRNMHRLLAQIEKRTRKKRLAERFLWLR